MSSPFFVDDPDQHVTRPDWPEWLMELAFVVAKRGSCLRKQVGAIIVRDRDKAIVGQGYNGAPKGMPDCMEVGCELRDIGGKPSCVRTLHAESNALDRAVFLPEPHTIYCTVIPCRDCALRIIQNGWIKKVVYSEYYESRNSKDTEALFAGRDDDSIAQMTKRFGSMETSVWVPTPSGWVPTPRVELMQMAGPTSIEAQKLAWEQFLNLHTIGATKDALTLDLATRLCHALGVSTEPDDA